MFKYLNCITFRVAKVWGCNALAKVLVACAWPYINYVPHLGTMIGSILSADVVARYYRLKGDDVVFVSGSDEHGTPIEVEALRLGVSPKQLTDQNHKLVVDLFEKWGISFDNYTRTESETHKKFVQQLFLKIYENGYVFTEETELPYCQNCNRFLPDRFVEGTCPYCGYEGARGDQCESCGRLLEPTKLIKPYCSLCKNPPIIKKTKHWYFDLPKFAEKLQNYIENNRQFPDNARNFSLNLIKEGLKPRAITRDNKWGIPAPFPGAEDKTIYVWLEAVLGYVSATIEHFERLGKEEEWKKYWLDKNAKTLFFVGKDNIPFHTLILPALLLATHEDYNLPWNVPSTEFLNFEGKRFSKSHRIGVWIDDALKLFPPDYWRYYLISIRPEKKDSSFSWKTFKETINADLNDTLGNFIHRTLTFINQHFNNEVPKPENLDTYDKKILRSVKKKVKKIAESLEECKLQAALRQVISLGRLGNQYLNEKEPWNTIKTDRQQTANTLYVSIQIIKALAIALEPFIPFTAEKLWKLLNLEGTVHTQKWEEATKPLSPNHKINKAQPLFSKIEATEEELKTMTEKIATQTSTQTVSYQEFSKLDLRVGVIKKAERVPKSQNLLKLTIDIGEGQLKQAVAGIAQYYEPKQLEGKHVAIIANLQPRKIFGLESEVMILAAEDEKTVSILQPDTQVKAGSKIK
ncbi:MAG: methionine--tRNA ligase [Candidatus Bathyarchaeia archaeon]